MFILSSSAAGYYEVLYTADKEVIMTAEQLMMYAAAVGMSALLSFSGIADSDGSAQIENTQNNSYTDIMEFAPEAADMEQYRDNELLVMAEYHRNADTEYMAGLFLFSDGTFAAGIFPAESRLAVMDNGMYSGYEELFDSGAIRFDKLGRLDDYSRDFIKRCTELEDLSERPFIDLTSEEYALPYEEEYPAGDSVEIFLPGEDGLFMLTSAGVSPHSNSFIRTGEINSDYASRIRTIFIGTGNYRYWKDHYGCCD